MLKLVDIKKEYVMPSYTVNALNNVNLSFREHEFVSILGPSGCGKSTMLNIIGGLDRYSSGDLIIDGVSTKTFQEKHWDAYRNESIGFVFQSYNLIAHLSLVENVEIALTIAGMSKSQRRKKAEEALEKVGMKGFAKRMPSQISGGQVQRVAIARALVTNPDIILADEPTGALDTKLSVQIMELLSEISKEKLVILVTHNRDLAQTYSSRIIEILDGEIISDSKPYVEEVEIEKQTNKKDECDIVVNDAATDTETVCNNQKGRSPKGLLEKLGFYKETNPAGYKKTKMGFTTAATLSLKNMFSKKVRTALTSFAGSIGIIGIGLVLALSYGFNLYLERMQVTVLAKIPIGIYEYSLDYQSFLSAMRPPADKSKVKYPDSKEIIIVDEIKSGANLTDMDSMLKTFVDAIGVNQITPEFVDYIKNMPKDYTVAVNFVYGTKMNIIAKHMNENGVMAYKDVSRVPDVTNAMTIAGEVMGSHTQQTLHWHQLFGDENFIRSYYDVIDGKIPTAKNELVLVVSDMNYVSYRALETFAIDIYNRDSEGKIIGYVNGKTTTDSYKPSITLKDLQKHELHLVTNNSYYTKSTEGEKTRFLTPDSANQSELENCYTAADCTALKIVGILRPRPDSQINLTGTNLCFMSSLAEDVKENSAKSEITQAQIDEYNNAQEAGRTPVKVTDGSQIHSDKLAEGALGILEFMQTGLKKSHYDKSIAYNTQPTYMAFYPKDFKSKNKIMEYLGEYNNRMVAQHRDAEVVNTFDVTEIFVGNMRLIADLVTKVLIIVASISLVVSSFMIAIITANSVVERTREIGILRAMGARRMDIFNIFTSETGIIGLFSGLLGIIITAIATPIVNLVLKAKVGVVGVMHFYWLHAIALLLISLGLTLIAGLIPSQIAARKNVVDALRIE